MLRAGRPDAMSIMSPSAYKTARARLSACVAWRCVEKARNKSGDSKLSDVALNYRKTVGAAGGGGQQRACVYGCYAFFRLKN